MHHLKKARRVIQDCELSSTSRTRWSLDSFFNNGAAVKPFGGFSRAGLCPVVVEQHEALTPINALLWPQGAIRAASHFQQSIQK